MKQFKNTFTICLQAQKIRAAVEWRYKRMTTLEVFMRMKKYLNWTKSEIAELQSAEVDDIWTKLRVEKIQPTR